MGNRWRAKFEMGLHAAFVSALNFASVALADENSLEGKALAELWID